jgi:hypothetical protein
MCWVGDTAVTIALTYGSEVDWLKNLFASGGGEIVVGGRPIAIGMPILLETREGRRRVPAVVRGGLVLVDSDEFVELPIR